MQSGVFIRTSSGNDPARLVARLTAKVRPDAAAVQYALERQRARILERTERGVDVEGRAFAPYSTKGPYYHNPGGGVRSTEKQEKAAAKRFLHKITTAAERSKDNAPKLSRTGRSIRFPSYAAFKQWLGRRTIDLRGPRAPHMLQAIVIKLTGGDVVTEAHLGIYGEGADRATGHNEGAKHLPKRRFFGVSRQDLQQIASDILAHLKVRT